MIKWLPHWLKRYQLPLLIFMIGFTNNLAPIFVLHFREVNSTPSWQLMLLQSLFFMSYFLVVVPVFYLMRWIGIRLLATYACLLCALSCCVIAGLFHLPQASTLLIGIASLALALGALRVVVSAEIMTYQTARHYHHQVASMLCNDTVGALLCPPIAAYMLNRSTFYEHSPASGSLIFFLLLATGFMLLGVAKLQTPSTEVIAQDRQATIKDFATAFRLRPVHTGFWMIFVFIGLEFSIPMFIGLLASQSTLSVNSAFFISMYWVFILIGRLSVIHFNIPIQPSRFIYGCSTVGISLIILSISLGSYAPILLTFLGLFNANLYPAIFSSHSKTLHQSLHYVTSGIFLMGLSGGAIIPLVQEYLALYVGLHGSFLIILVCYAILIIMTPLEGRAQSIAVDQNAQLELT